MIKAFHKATDTEAYIYRQVSADNTIEMGLRMVIFGWRISVGHVGGGIYELDYCAGDREDDIERIYQYVLTALSNNTPLNRFPVQTNRPIYNDKECDGALKALCEGCELLEIPDFDLRMKRLEILMNL